MGDTAIKRLINSGLEGTSVTCILIGSETFQRRWVRYEIVKSFKRGNWIFGIHINSIQCKNRFTKPLGPDPLKFLGVTYSGSGMTATLHEVKDGKWHEYFEVDGRSSYQLLKAQTQFGGKGINLSQLYPTYDWHADEGYNNFSKWVG